MRRLFRLQCSLPDVGAVLGRLGYNPHKTDVADWRQRIEHAISAYENLLEAKGVVDTVPVVQRTEDTIILAGGIALVSRKLATVLARSEEVTVCAATLGYGVIETIEKLIAQQEVTQAAILDAIASEAVEHFVDWMQAILVRERLRFGYGPTMRFSPGYGDWKLKVQPQLLDFLHAEEIGLSSQPESHILHPEKSITAVIGWEKIQQ
ncbi:hypothetical protein [Thermospira aquatica]|uniref:Methionine synthase n=1 Tax=Thermospira aquatica TaxID=2828656 RepID=A0AAX3BD92_9SPIR|nr:hypothetical protein [Thermospira aquatica]URA10277.1 hypothetical protein KDW03_00275 [Thermospira aquatica]